MRPTRSPIRRSRHGFPRYKKSTHIFSKSSTPLIQITLQIAQLSVPQQCTKHYVGRQILSPSSTLYVSHYSESRQEEHDQVSAMRVAAAPTTDTESARVLIFTPSLASLQRTTPIVASSAGSTFSQRTFTGPAYKNQTASSIYRQMEWHGARMTGVKR